MKITTLLMVLSLMLVLPGCLDVRPHQQAEAPTIVNSPKPSGTTKEDLAETADGLKKEITTSQNAIQSNMQALVGASIGKVSDELIHATADLKDILHAEISNKIGDIQNHMSASLASNNDLRAMLKAQLKLNASLQIRLNAQAQAMVDAKLNAIAAGIAGKIESTTNDLKQNLQAGHDVNNINQQFTKEVLAAIQSSNATNAWNTTVANLVLLGIIIAAAVTVCLVFRGRAKASADDAREARGELKFKQVQLERAMGALAPQEVDRVFPKSGSGTDGSPPR